MTICQFTFVMTSAITKFTFSYNKRLNNDSFLKGAIFKLTVRECQCGKLISKI